jgi:hypothetical protein
MRQEGDVPHMGQEVHSSLGGQTGGRDRDHLQDASVNGIIILKRIFKKSVRGTDWIDLPQDRDRWRAIVKAAKNRSKFRKMCENS